MEYGKSQKSRMLAGEDYFAWDPELQRERAHAQDVCMQFNHTHGEEERLRIVRSQLGIAFPPTSPPFITPSFQCDYGWNIAVGENFYANYNCVILDCAPVRFGDNCNLGPNVQVYTAHHPIAAVRRRSGAESARPITVGDDCWLGGSCVLCPGVTIGDRVVVGAGAVVTRDLPDDVVAVGNPARVLRHLSPNDQQQPMI